MADFDDDADDRLSDDAPTDERAALQKRHQQALSHFKVSASYFAPQRRREMEDLKFIDFDEQWDPAVKANRAGNQTVNGLPPTPARPSITINQLRGPCQQVASQRRNARLALNFSPKGSGAKQEIAEVYDDIVRAIQVESRASIARNWAADRAEKAGLGWYRIDTQYAIENPTDPADPAWNDQEIVYRRILNQAAVYPDPFSQEPDFSDGKRLFITEDLPWETYKVRYPASKLAGMDDSDLTGVGDRVPEFVMTADLDGEQGRTVRIAEVWEVIETERTRVALADGMLAYADDLPDGAEVATGAAARSRVIRERKVWHSVINAVEFLEAPTEWNGSYIPVVPVIGDESNVNGERRWTGIVRPGKEAAVSYNVMRSAQIEAIASAAKSPWIGYYETIEPYIEWWKHANTRNFPMLPIKAARGPDGSVLPPPQRNVAEPAIQAITLAAQSALSDIHATTGVPPVALGQLDPHERSGKAIQALQQQAETGVGGYLDNLVNISMPYDGRVLRDLIPRIYDRPGRIVPAIGLDESRRMVMINVPFGYDPAGDPVTVPGWQPGLPVPEGAIYLDLTSGEYSVQATVGKAYNTRRQEASSAITNVMQVVPPEMAAAIAPAMLEELDYPGARKIAEIAKKALPSQLAAAYQDDKGSQIPPEIQAQLQQLQQENQQLKQMVESEQAKEQAVSEREIMKAQASMQTAQQKAQMDAQLAQQSAQIEAQTAVAKAQIDAETRIQVAQINAQASLTEASIKAGAADAGHQVAREEQLIGNDHELEVQARDHEHEHAVVAHQAAVAPEPSMGE